MINFLLKLLGDANEKKVKKISGIIDHINSLEPEFEKLTDEELRAKTDEFKAILAKRPTSDNEKADRLLEKEEFILHFPDQTTGQLALELFETWGIKPQVSVRTRNTETSVRLCMEGMGLSFVPETYIKNMHFDTPPACFSVGEKGVFSTLTIASRKGAYLPSYAQDFIKIAQEQL